MFNSVQQKCGHNRRDRYHEIEVTILHNFEIKKKTLVVTNKFRRNTVHILINLSNFVEFRLKTPLPVFSIPLAENGRPR